MKLTDEKVNKVVAVVTNTVKLACMRINWYEGRARVAKIALLMAGLPRLRAEKLDRNMGKWSKESRAIYATICGCKSPPSDDTWNAFVRNAGSVK